MPSVVVLIYAHLLILPGVGTNALPDLHVHKLMLSEPAQEYVSLQTEHSSPGYVVHLFNYCEYYQSHSGELQYVCDHKPAAFFWFNFQKILGLPDRVVKDKSSGKDPVVTRFYRKLQLYKRLSLCYSLLTLVTAISRLSVVTVIVPLRLMQMRMLYTTQQLYDSRFIMLRNVFAFSYILAFVTANLLVPVAYLLYHFRFYENIYDTLGHAGLEHSLSPAAAGFNGLAVILSYIELYPALTYMSRWPGKEKRKLRHMDLESVFESYQLESYDPSSMSRRDTQGTSLSPYYKHSISQHESGSTSFGTSSRTCYDSEINIEGHPEPNSPSSSVLYDMPSLQASSYGLESDAMSEVSTANLGDIYTPSASAAPSIRSLSTQAERLISN